MDNVFSIPCSMEAVYSDKQGQKWFYLQNSNSGLSSVAMVNMGTSFQWNLIWQFLQYNQEFTTILQFPSQVTGKQTVMWGGE